MIEDLSKKNVYQYIYNYIGDYLSQFNFKYYKSLQELKKKTETGFLSISIFGANYSSYIEKNYTLNASFHTRIDIVNSIAEEFTREYGTRTRKELNNDPTSFTVTNYWSNSINPYSTESFYEKISTFDDVQECAELLLEFIKKNIMPYFSQVQTVEGLDRFIHDEYRGERYHSLWGSTSSSIFNGIVVAKLAKRQDFAIIVEKYRERIIEIADVSLPSYDLLDSFEKLLKKLETV